MKTTTINTPLFKTLLKEAELINECGICTLNVDYESVELAFNFNIDDNEFYTEAFAKYSEISFGEFEAVENYTLTEKQEEVLKNKIYAFLGEQVDEMAVNEQIA